MSILRQKKLILTAIIPLFLIIGLSVQSYAATNSVASTTLTGLSGITYTVDSAAGFTITNPAYFVTRDTSTNTSIWSNGGNMTTALTAGNWQFQVNATANAALSGRHIATVQVDSSASSGYTTLETIDFTAEISTSDTMTLIFDMDATSIDDVTAIVVTIT